MLRLLVAGGGTGGHLFPGVAVAEEFLRRDQNAEILFVGTGRPVEGEVLGPRKLAACKITAFGFKGKGLLGRLRSIFSIPLGLVQSMSLLGRFKPDLVLGVGGYVTGPVGVAARMMGLPMAIHEQNSIPGMTNRLLGRVVSLIFISFESSARFFPAGKTHVTGNPIRQEIARVGPRERKEGQPFIILVVGGSQGAHAINENMVKAAEILQSRGLSFFVIHQTGVGDYDTVKTLYKKINVAAEVRIFIDRMGLAYQAADLVVCRAGALTVAEVAATGRPAIFVPLPTAANNHQEYNARWLVDTGAAEIILQKDLTPELLADRIERLAGDREKLGVMARAAIKAALPDAAQTICDICTVHLQGRKKRWWRR